MKLPNGYGSVYKLSGKRRNPWMARKTVGWTDTGRPKYYYIGYYKTRQEALQALSEYNMDPKERKKRITLRELYDMWSGETFEQLSPSTIAQYKNAFKVAEPIADMDVSSLHLDQFQEAATASGKYQNTLYGYKVVMKSLISYGIKHELVDSEKLTIVNFIDLKRYEKRSYTDRSIYSKDAIAKLWQHTDDPAFQWVLVLLFTGCRLGELCDLKPEHVHLDDQYFEVVKAKTSSGVRQVPIIDELVPFFRQWMTLEAETVFPAPRGGRMSHAASDAHFARVASVIGEEHRPHDTRHTLITRLTEIGTDPRIIKSIVGHKTTDVTEAIYTHISNEVKMASIRAVL